MSIEYELKFRASEQSLNILRQQYADEGTLLQMLTTYYDTPSGGLSAKHYTLRRRLENGVSVCTLKTPAEGYGRHELEVQCDSIDDALPQFSAMGAPADFAALVAEGLVPVCGAKFTRQAIALRLPESAVELALDQGILFGGAQEQPLCEVEVELKEGDRMDACRFAAALAEKYGLDPESHSKFRRALALYKGETL